MEQQTGSKLGKEYIKAGSILLSQLFNLYAKHIMQNTGLEEVQAGIKISRKNIKTSDIQMTPPFYQKARKNQRVS